MINAKCRCRCRPARNKSARSELGQKLGGPGWSWFTGWFNVIGLLAVVASVDYAAATFGSTLFNLWGLDLGVINFADDVQLDEVFAVFVVLLLLLRHGA